MPDISFGYTFLSRNTVELCAFVVVAKHGQLSSAARELQNSQPGLSQRIKNLEDTLGRKLFDRTHRGVRLNAEGQELFERVEPLLGPLAARFQEFANRAKTPAFWSPSTLPSRPSGCCHGCRGCARPSIRSTFRC